MPGQRHSAADRADIQQMHDLAIRQGARCGHPVKALVSPPQWAIKAVGNGRVEGFLVRHTSPDEADIAGDYFDDYTDLGVRDGAQLPLLWHHGLDKTVGAKPVGVGTVKRLDAGLWFSAQLNMRDEYERFMYKLAEMKKAGFSSGAKPESVVRKAVPGKPGKYWIARWHLREGSLTPTPAAGLDLTAVNIKSLLLPDVDRRRKLELQLRLLQIECS